jgi:hypothetical protein
MTFPLPTPEAIGKMLSNLLGRKIVVKPAAAPAAPGKKAVATYATASSPAAMVAVLDLPLACSLGAALSMIPAAVASQSVRSGTVASNLLENLEEVMNVTAALLGAGGPVRLALEAVFPPGKSLPPEAQAVVARPAARVDFEIAVSGYEAGTLTVLAA